MLTISIFNPALFPADNCTTRNLVAEIYDQCNPPNAQDYEDEDHFMLPSQGSPYVRLTKTNHSYTHSPHRQQQGRDKRANLLGDLEKDSNNNQQQAQQRQQQYQYQEMLP